MYSRWQRWSKIECSSEPTEKYPNASSVLQRQLIPIHWQILLYESVFLELFKEQMFSKSVICKYSNCITVDQREGCLLKV